MNLSSGLYTDLYQLTMAQSYFLHGKHNTVATFDYFFRKNPFESGYVLFCGLEQVLDWLEKVSFTKDDLAYLKDQGFREDFLEYLGGFSFRGHIKSMEEGQVVFPFAPILSVTASVVECQIIETYLLNILNFQSLIATKASRVRYVAGKQAILSEFGLRRSQGYAGLLASRAAYIGGFDSTSNVLAGKEFEIPISGTMSHAFIQSYDDELTAFMAYAETFPDNCTLLVDTYNTLKSGMPHAIEVAKHLKSKGHQLAAIRLDSGDLAYLSRTCRNMLDAAGFPEVKIAASNQLDEHVIRSLKEQEAAIDIYGVGTNLVVGRSNGALDGVYKLCSFDGIPRIKISENLKKMNLPGSKQVYRYLNPNGLYMGDAIAMETEQTPNEMVHPFEPHKAMAIASEQGKPMLREVMNQGKRSIAKKSTQEIAEMAKQNLQLLPREHKRFDNPHVYKVGISRAVEVLRDDLKNQKK
ncbi:nicotinate phosphoribosyltransferase [Mangrovimonas sp. AS39]|uniref:nicotinate phosphoribosyltransferase n=1 Tax=Mangrovimonas futianensis TaxID=2895523 RepID=UPI001E653823|nr:nicotinate phosphoribosyltransferase [Mangrovimonas futianensis]MCF1190379.1 nicotinate phosphoribosyltransferase [Mangrovimonas futianensis]MCF1193868.1 nicotinate phosphoribosyltransferase [Mangrovimonas futianensis]